MSMIDDDDYQAPGEEADSIPDTAPSGAPLVVDLSEAAAAVSELFSVGEDPDPGWVWRCDQSGGAQSECRAPEDSRCPNHGLPVPNASCAGAPRGGS